MFGLLGTALILSSWVVWFLTEKLICGFARIQHVRKFDLSNNFIFYCFVGSAVFIELFCSWAARYNESLVQSPRISSREESAAAVYVRKDQATVLPLSRPLAEQENAVDEYNLALRYYLGQAVPQDYAEAAKWYRKAADQGYAAAQSDLGYLYANGQGVAEDYAEAVKWYRLAAGQGDPLGQYNLAGMYITGHGVRQDYAEGTKWLRLAADQGNGNAQIVLGLAYVSGQGVPQDYSEAAKWICLAADQGALDLAHWSGQGRSDRAADQALAFAQYILGGAYANGQGVPRDFVRAYFWFSSAVSQGNEDAVRAREALTRTMSPAQIAEAQRLTREREVGEPNGSSGLTPQEKETNLSERHSKALN